MAITPVGRAVASALVVLATMAGCTPSDPTAKPAFSAPAPSPTASSALSPAPTSAPTALGERVHPAVKFQGRYAYREVATKSNTRSYAKVGATSRDTWMVDTSCAATCVSRVAGSDGSIRELTYAKKKWTWTGTYESDCVNAANGKKTGKKVTSKVTLTLAATKTRNGLVDQLAGTVTDYQISRCTGGESTLVKVKYRATVKRQV